MSYPNRLAARNVHIYDFKQPDTVLGGLYLAKAQDITNSSFYAMLENFIVLTEIPSFQNGHKYFLQSEDGATIARDDGYFKPGTYYLVSTGECLN